MATYKFYADPSDGYIASTSATYANARAGTGTLTLVGPSDGGLRFGQQLASGTYSVWQSFISFDTSAITDDRKIAGVQIQMALAADASTTNFTMEARVHDWGTTLETTDFVAGSDLASKPLFASFTSSPGGFLDGADNVGTLVNTSGRTSLVLASSRQGANTAPTNAINEYIEFRSADYGTTATDPALTVITAPYIDYDLGTNTTKTTGTSLAITTTSAVPAGESIIIAFTMDPAGGTVSATDSASNTYTVLADVTNGSGAAGVRLVLLAAHGATAMAAGSTITVTHPSCAARAVTANTFLFDDTGTKVTSQTATGSSTTPSVNVKSPVLHPLILSAVAVEGPLSDTFTNDATFLGGAVGSIAGTDAGGATTNVTVRMAFRAPVDETDYTYAPTLGTSRLWAAAEVVLDTVDARIRTFVEAEGMRSAAIPGESVVDTGVAYNPATGFATELRCTILDPALTIYYGCVIGGTTYGGTMSYGETIVALPASTVGVVIDAEANVSFTGLDGDLDLRVPA